METISPNKTHIRNYPTKIHNHPFISDDFNYLHTMGRNFIQAAPPPFLSHHSYPPFSLHQPPLLPLPAAVRRRSPATSPPASKKSCRIRKEEKSKISPKKNDSPKKFITHVSSSTRPLGPDPKELSKDVAKVLPFISSGNIYSSNSNIGVNNTNNSLMRCVKAVELDDGIENMYSGSVVCSISPPPSSLPLPTFSMRPKLISCNVEAAAGIDAGATDNLRRLLRLR